MTKQEVAELLKDLSVDERMDVLMHLAEEFQVKVVRGEEDVTYFLSTDDEGMIDTHKIIQEIKELKLELRLKYDPVVLIQLYNAIDKLR